MVNFAIAQTDRTPTPDSAGLRRPSPTELARLGDQIAEIAAYTDAACHRMLVELREFDRWEGWSGGFLTCAHWLSWRTGIELGAAREKVRVARALEHLPLISEGLRTAALSYSKVRAVTRIATPANEESLNHFALHGTTAQLERLVRAWRKVDRQEEARLERERHASRYVTLHSDGDMFELRGRLDPEVGMALKRALEAASWTLYRNQPATREAPVAARRADAIGLLAECALEGGTLETREDADAEARREVDAVSGLEPDACDDAPVGAPVDASGDARRNRPAASRHPDHRLVVVHVDAEALMADAEGGNALLEDGTRVSAETSRRLACDASRVIMTHGPDGVALDVGRKARTVPAALRRMLDQRDGGCRFPGCGSRFCDAHHVRHWADGGETRLGNLVLLCRVHHRAVHEDGFTVAMIGGEPRFGRPDGRPLPDVPPCPTLRSDPLDALQAMNVAVGGDVTSDAALTYGTGGRFDLDYAIAVMWRPPD